MDDKSFEAYKAEFGLLKKKDVAEMLGVNLRTVDNMVKRKELDAYKIGSVIRFKRSDVAKFLDRNKIK